jgi:hypothetical protein
LAAGFSARWLDDSSEYMTFEASRSLDGGRDLMRHDPKTGAKEIMVPAGDFVSPGESSFVRHCQQERQQTS